MRRHWQYLLYVLRHKWFVFLECSRLNVPIWNAVFHDWTKFRPSEWFPYARFFHNPDGTLRQIRDKTGYYKPTDTGSAEFDHAWFLHAKRNKHHWQWWAMPTESSVKYIPIPDTYIREMIADWRGAGRAQGTPDTLAWYRANRDKIQLHESTRRAVERYLDYRD